MDYTVSRDKENMMADYIQFTAADGSTLLVEVDESEISAQRGVQKAGIREATGKTIAVAQNTFEQAIKQAITHNAQTFLEAVLGLSILPNEAEVSFGLKMTGEFGNVAVAKAGGEANYTVTLTWKRDAKNGDQDEH
jgi:hypothetical protein